MASINYFGQFSHSNPPLSESSSEVKRTDIKSCGSRGKSNAPGAGSDTAPHGGNHGVSRVAYQATTPAQDALSGKSHPECEHIRDNYTHGESSAVTTLTAECPHCEDGTVWRSRHGGNDPDVWAVRCEECDGTGEVVVSCECCREAASERFDGLMLCAAHAAEARAEAMDAQLAKIEALTDWCREHVRPPPADLLYDAVGALESLRRAA